MSGHPDTARHLTTESMSTLSCSVFWLFLPNILKFDRYSFDIYCFKVGAFFGRQCTFSRSAKNWQPHSGHWPHCYRTV